MRVQIARWGNSAAGRLPKAVLKQVGLAEASQVDVVVANGVLVITAAAVDQPTLADLIGSLDETGPGGRSEGLGWGPDREAEIIDDDYSTSRATPAKGRAKRAS